MNNLFECKVRYGKMNESGITEKITETYLVDALTFSEAETRIIEEVTPYVNSELDVLAIKRANLSEIITTQTSEADKWFKMKVMFITLDEKAMREKKTPVNMLVQAADTDDAKKRLDESMKTTMVDYEVHTIQETPIIDYFPYRKSS